MSQITTKFLTDAEIKTIRDGYSHMIDNGYSRIDGVQGVLKRLAIEIERARRELDYVTRHQFPSAVASAELHIRCDEAMLSNLASRAAA